MILFVREGRLVANHDDSQDFLTVEEHYPGTEKLYVPDDTKVSLEDMTYELHEDAEFSKKLLEKEIRKEYEKNSEAPVEYKGVFFNGGIDSASYIKGALDLSRALGESEVIITDSENKPQTLSPLEVEELIVTIGLKFREAFFIKQQKLVELRSSHGITT